jgi:hypothetical protein
MYYDVQYVLVKRVQVRPRPAMKNAPWNLYALACMNNYSK